MKKLIMLSILSMVTLAGYAPSRNTINILIKPPFKPYEAVFRACCMVESGNDPMALNRKEMAVGIVQIRPVRLQDYNRRTGRHYRLSDCYDPKISREIFMYYIRQYGVNRRDDAIRAWNGSGKATYVYLTKVKKYL